MAEPLITVIRRDNLEVHPPGRLLDVFDLETAIYDYLLQHSAKPEPFTWPKTADDILTRQRSALNALDEIRGSS